MNEKRFREALVNWYQQNKRPLPWRLDPLPYHVWLSEIMCQQTQVDTVIPFYQRFLTKFPTIESLASASLDDVYHVWQGLGYYRRAMHLHLASKMVVDDYHGVFPNTQKELMTLKGVGSYTGAAIASICFNEPVGVVDGNVFRVLSRVFALSDNIALPKTKKLFEQLMNDLIDQDNPGDFNQAMMELGAMICSPTNPNCEVCPVASQCTAHELKQETAFPVSIKSINKKELYLITGILVNRFGIYMYKNEESLLRGLYQFPQIETQDSHAFESYLKDSFTIKSTLVEHKGLVKHVFSHRVWHMNVYIGVIDDDVTVIPFDQIHEIAISKAHQKVLQLYQFQVN